MLTESGVNFVDVPGGGIMAFIEGPVPGKTVYLWADIDALPIEEDTCNNKQPKACLSKIPGVAAGKPLALHRGSHHFRQIKQIAAGAVRIVRTAPELLIRL